MNSCWSQGKQGFNVQLDKPGEAINYTALLLKEQKVIFQRDLAQKKREGKTLQK